jgi:hypothetical protein
MSIIRTGLALALLAGSFSFGSPAVAQDIELRIGPDGVRPVIRDRDRDRFDRDRRDRRDRRGCSPQEARDAARDEGFRRPEVVRLTDRSITIQGFTRNGPDRIRFANRRGCPIIG